MRDPTEGRPGRNGYLLPMMMVLLLISMIVGMSIFYIGGLERINATKRLNMEKAFNIAEAGVQRAYANLKVNGSWQPETSLQPLGGGTFQVTQNTQADTITLVSTGRFADRQNVVELVLTNGGGDYGVFGRGIFGATDVIISNNALVDSYDSRLGSYGSGNNGLDGDVGSNMFIQVSNNGTVKGDASVSTGDPDDITVGNNGVITGTRDASAQARTLPPVVVPSALQSLAYPVQGDARITLLSGSYTISSGNLTVSNNSSIRITGGDLRFKNITVSNNASASVTNNTRIYIEQDWGISNNGTFRFDGTGEVYMGEQFDLGNNAALRSLPGANNLAIYCVSAQPQTISNNAVAINGSIYAPLATVTVSNNAEFFGSIVANEVVLGNNGKIHYDVAVQDLPPPGEPVINGGQISFVKWRKPGWSNRLQ